MNGGEALPSALASELIEEIRTFVREGREYSKQAAEDRKQVAEYTRQAAEYTRQAAEDRKQAAVDRRVFVELSKTLGEYMMRVADSLERLQLDFADYRKTSLTWMARQTRLLETNNLLLRRIVSNGRLPGNGRPARRGN